ncbi:MAG: hypothetical protein IJY18_00650 [Clostridia bacterium]|nr:hypothetical protein [Clostridia bacterium]
MKKLLCLALALSLLFSLFSCGGAKYEPRESTEEEARVVMTYSIDGATYEVKYELYRAIFLNFISEYDYKKDGFFDTDEGKAAVDSVNETFKSLSADIYATLHLAKKIGYDPYSADADKAVSELIAEDVENEYFGGDYEKYLSELKNINLNYSTQDLILHYQLAYDKIVDYYKGTVDPDNPSTDMTEGALEYTEDDVRDFYFGESSVRVSIIKISHDLPLSEARVIRDKLAAMTDEKDALYYASSSTISDPYDVYMGAVIGRNSSDYVFYGDVMKEAFALGLNETGKVHDISSGVEPIYWVLYRTAKTEEHFLECYDDIADSYLSEKIGAILGGVTDSLKKSAETTEVFDSISHKEIEMK